MSDLIRREDARAAMCKFCAYSELCEKEVIKRLESGEWCCEAMDYIDGIPAADAVKVVRCRDCKYRHIKDEYEAWCTGNGSPARLVRPDGYCSSGKRREDGDA